jgi:hypothetical protein
MNTDKELLKYYMLVDKYGEVKGTYEKFESAFDLKESTDEVRYFNGFETIYNVNGQWGEK